MNENNSKFYVDKQKKLEYNRYVILKIKRPSKKYFTRLYFRKNKE